MIQKPRGTRDFTPKEMEMRREVEALLRQRFENFGFKEIATPTFEHAKLFIQRSGEGVIDQMYVFKDKSGRLMALRPELTAPAIRFYMSDLQDSPKPLKLYYFGNAFRYERPQYGRFREFWHFGAELIGSKPLESDAEVVGLAVSSLKHAGLKDFIVRIGHVGILRALLKSEGIIGEEQTQCMQLIDKGDLPSLSVKLRELEINEQFEKRLFQLIRLKGGVEVLDKAEEITKGDEEVLSQILYLREMLDLLALYQIKDCLIDLSVARGLDYYTGMVFEIDVQRLGAEKQICGGGSYSLSNLFKADLIFSTGFAIGFDRLILALQKQGYIATKKSISIYIVPIGEESRKAAYAALCKLRESGISADIDLMNRSPSKCLKYADAMDVKKVAIIGKKELADESIMIRDMTTGEQQKVKIEELVEFLKK